MVVVVVVVVLVVIIIIVVVGGGGNNFYTWTLGKPMYGFGKIKSKTPFSLVFSMPMYGLDAHVWSRRGVTPHSEILV